MKKLSSILAILFATLMFTSCISNVDPTEEGFKISNAGDYRGVDSLPTVSGWNAYMPGFTRIVTIPTTQQHVVWSEAADEGSNPNEQVTIACKGGAGFKVDVMLNFRVKANHGSRIYLRYKTSDLQTITANTLRAIVRTSMNDISGTLTVDSILNNQPAFEAACRDLIIQRFDKLDFIVDAFGIIHKPTPTDPQLAASINNKIKAKQDAETSIMQLQGSIAEANKEVAKARGDSAVAVIRAQGEAEAVRKIQQVLTPTYVEYKKVEKWNGAQPTVVGGGSGMILQLKQ